MWFTPCGRVITNAKNDLSIRVDLYEIFDEETGRNVAGGCIAIIDLAEQRVSLRSWGTVDFAKERGWETYALSNIGQRVEAWGVSQSLHSRLEGDVTGTRQSRLSRLIEIF